MFLIIVALIKKDSPGPAFFRQERVGKDGEKFLMYKFRTMNVESDPYAITPNDNQDPRITRVGRILRRMSLDETPQFFNVLKGEMSIVGPRPEMPFIVKEYDEYQKTRLSIKSGVTGLWQLYGDKQRPIHEDLDYDITYIKRQSFLQDIEIILKTGCFVMKSAFRQNSSYRTKMIKYYESPKSFARKVLKRQ